MLSFFLSINIALSLIVLNLCPIILFQNCKPMVRVFASGPGDLGSIPDRVIRKTLKTVLGTSLFNTKHNKVPIKGIVEKSRERSSALPDTLV